MDSQRLAEIEARCEAATEGPWEVAWKTDFIWQLDGDGDRFGPIAEAHYAEGNHDNNAAFIAHARDDVPDLLAEVRRLTAENEAMRDILKPFMPLIVPPGCNVWALVKAVVSGLRKPIPMPEEDPIRKDVWVGGRSDVVARLGDD